MTSDLAAELGYSHATGNPLHRVARWGAGTRAGGWVFSRVLRHLDDAMGRMTGGRRSAPGLLAGLEVLDVTTTGRRSGMPRTSHLIATPYDGGLALIGTNFGQAATPAWALNLESDPRATVSYRGASRLVVARAATPRATVSYRGASRLVVARAATPAEADDVFRTAARFYPGYAHYRERVGQTRRIRVFVLEPA